MSGKNIGKFFGRKHRFGKRTGRSDFKVALAGIFNSSPHQFFPGSGAFQFFSHLGVIDGKNIGTVPEIGHFSQGFSVGSNEPSSPAIVVVVLNFHGLNNEMKNKMF